MDMDNDITTTHCKHCHREVSYTAEGWADMNATGDDSLWKYVCEDDDTFVAGHEPVGFGQG